MTKLRKKSFKCMSQFSGNSAKNPGVIVLGGHVQALGILRIFGREGIPGIIIDDARKNLARHSKYCTSFYHRSDDQLLQFLLGLGKNKKYQDWIIFPSNDFHVKILSENKKLLEKFYIISTDEWEVISLFYNKRATYKLASNLEIPIAPTYFPKNERELDSIRIQYPCIVKPAVMHKFYRQVRKKVLVCRDKEELEKNYRKAVQFIPANEIIIQEIIRGPGRNQFSACFLFLNGKTFVHLVACRMRQHPLDFGNATTYAETVDIPILKEYGERILKAANYNGVCEVEFKLDERDNRYKFLEVNTRTWKWHTIANKAETPFLKIYYDYLTGNKIEQIKGYKNASFSHMITDFPTQLQLLANGAKYWKRKMSPVECAVWANDDPMPWFWEKIYLPYLIMNR